MRVQASDPQTPVPMEGRPGQFITAARNVPNTAYYRRRLARGELVEVEEASP